VLVAESHALIRDGISAILERVPELRVVAEASDGAEAFQLIRQQRPDVALIQSAIPKLNGFEATARVRKECPGVHLIILSMDADEECLRQSLDSGAAGYLTMTTSAAELVSAIKSAAEGKLHFSSAAINLLVDVIRRGAGKENLKGLTARQLDVLKLIAQGKTTKQIALILKISVKTVESHRMLLTERLDIHDTAGLVRYAIKAGLIHLES